MVKQTNKPAFNQNPTGLNSPDKLAPHSEDAEQAVLGSILINPDALLEVISFLNPDDFFIIKNNYVYAALLAIHERGEAIDYIVVVEELRTRGQLDAIGGAAYITLLTTNTPTHIHAETYGRIVERASIRRKLMQAATKIGQIALKEDMEIKDVLDGAEGELDKVSASWKQRGTGRLITMSEAVSEAFDTIDDRITNKSIFPGFQLGLPHIDNLFGGFDRGWCLSWIMPTSGGKTLLTVQTLLKLAQQTHTMLVSTEMYTLPVIRRMYSQTLGIDGKALRTGHLKDEEVEAVVAKTSELSNLPITFLESRRPTIQDIKKKAQRLKRRYGDHFGCLIVDAGSNVRSVGNDKIFDVTRDVATGLSELANELDLFVMVTWQINRQSYGKNGPGVTGGRGGGDIENEADFIFTFERPEYGYKTDPSTAPKEWDRIKAQEQERVIWRCMKDRHMSKAGTVHDMVLRFKGIPGFYEPFAGNSTPVNLPKGGRDAA